MILADSGVIAPKAYSNRVAGTVVDVTTNTQHLIYNINVTAATAAVSYLQVFDKQSGSVTLGTTVPDFWIEMPASNINRIELVKPLKFNTGFSIAGTTTSTGNTGVNVDVFITYAAAS